MALVVRGGGGRCRDVRPPASWQLADLESRRRKGMPSCRPGNHGRQSAMTSKGRVSGMVELRPIRLALIVAPDSHASLRRAIEIASVCWGGRTFPILQADETPAKVEHIAVRLGVDALIACD